MKEFEPKKKRYRKRKRILILKGGEKHREFIQTKEKTTHEELCRWPSKVEFSVYMIGVLGLVIFCGLAALILHGIC